MEKIGVAAVVEGLESFLGDMGKMDDAIRNLVSPTNILGTAFGALGDVLGSVGGFVVNTLAHAFGELLADAIQFVVTQVKELIHATIEAGKEFQTLSLRLNTLNFNDMTESEQRLEDAQHAATEETKEQLTWLQRLAATTPYDNTDISNVYTLARGYGKLHNILYDRGIFKYEDAGKKDVMKGVLQDLYSLDVQILMEKFSEFEKQTV